VSDVGPPREVAGLRVVVSSDDEAGRSGAPLAFALLLFAAAAHAAWLVLAGPPSGLDAGVTAVMLAAAVLSERLAIRIDTRSSYTFLVPLIVLGAILGGPTAAGACVLAAQLGRRKATAARRAFELGLGGTQALAAGLIAETVRDGETWILLAAFAGLFATASLNTVARTFLLRREDSGERSISPRVSRSAVIDLVECALATPIVAIVAFVSIASSTLAATGLASVVLALGLASRARASSVTALASERAAARRDQLTGAPNRRAFEEALAIEHARVARGGAPAGVFVVDIDRFKSVNDRFGHHVGDEVLVGVVERIKSGLRSPDLLARWGGEEIVILAPGIKTIDGLTAFGERVRRLVGDVPLATKTTAIPITVSVGGTLMDGRSSPQAALKAADGALYDAKRTRDTCVVARPPRSALRLDERSHRTAS